MSIGAASVVLMCVLSTLQLAQPHPDSWGWGVAAYYVLTGFARAVYESTNRTYYADWFPDEGPGAFANFQMFCSFGGCLGFVLLSLHQEVAVRALLATAAVAVVPCLLLAQALRRNTMARDEGIMVSFRG
eukprot:NODE_20366_length_801_cov_4.158754.p3 GENE.NODE_20366_length_801_cov_4.158754~~NODE_20366_length_801_cov_4.158754.p3  ORF type:complete len:130 (+),score=17.56 NODE_20366_length_801_cov_4.158754:270-659(+)